MQTEKLYSFEITPDEREAMYAAFVESARVNYSREIHTSELECALADRTLARITLSAAQVSVMLGSLERAIEAQETECGDWLRAVHYRRARESLIAKTRSQLHVVA